MNEIICEGCGQYESECRCRGNMTQNEREINALGNLIKLAEEGARTPDCWRDSAWRSRYYGYYNIVYDALDRLIPELTPLEPGYMNRVIDKTLREHYKATMNTKRVPSDYLLMFTEGGEANAIGYAVVQAQLNHTLKQIKEG